MDSASMVTPSFGGGGGGGGLPLSSLGRSSGLGTGADLGLAAGMWGVPAIVAIGGVLWYIDDRGNPISPVPESEGGTPAPAAAAPAPSSGSSVPGTGEGPMGGRGGSGTPVLRETGIRPDNEPGGMGPYDTYGGGGGGGGGGSATPAAGGSAGGGGGGGAYYGDTYSGGQTYTSYDNSGGGSSGSGSSNYVEPSEMPAVPAFGSNPNYYPVLPMTDIRRRTLENLAVPFGNRVGMFPSMPWREDMAPMFTTGAFGGIGGGAPAPAPASQPSGVANIPAYLTPAAFPAPAPSPASDPGMSMPPAPPAMAEQMPSLPPFNRPGTAAPGAIFNAGNGYLPQPAMQRPAPPPRPANAPPLPPSIAKRLGY